MMNFTLSKDGKRRATIQVKHRIGKVELVGAILSRYRWADAYAPDTQEAVDEIRSMTRGDIEKIVRDEYGMYGSELWTRCEGVCSPVTIAAEAVVNRKFPEVT